MVNQKLNWYAEQLPEGADVINPTRKDITFTLKYVASILWVVNNFLAFLHVEHVGYS